jgi:hypothetical protein
MSAPADQAHAALLADKHHTGVVVLHLVQPVGAAGTLSALVGSENVYAFRRQKSSVNQSTYLT